ncbi:hypothetical protein [Singulisphaera sp. GP187]|uniref:hypothetical protein n=1 Tax=Singulisphaera sp. GP187 TaxID=1882752 RepID=UPI001160F2C8|nr:hypothetical protein [Singulisphaera sp. GP187]
MAELARLWPSLPPALRDGIMAMARAATPTDATQGEVEPRRSSPRPRRDYVTGPADATVDVHEAEQAAPSLGGTGNRRGFVDLTGDANRSGREAVEAQTRSGRRGRATRRDGRS